MVDVLEAHSKKIGIYTSQRNWKDITNDTTTFSSYPLWYPHYDNDASFRDFKPFGAWLRPTMKQYRDNTQLCGVYVDKNWRP